MRLRRRREHDDEAEAEVRRVVAQETAALRIMQAQLAAVIGSLDRAQRLTTKER